MLNIFYGRENVNKEKFIFDNIKGSSLLIVPDQFTLQAERSAFFYLGKKGFMEDLQVVSISRLGSKVLGEVGGFRNMVNKYGRHMLLTKILGEKAGELELFAKQSDKTSFVEMMNDVISELKQYDVTPEELAEIIEQLDDDSYLRMKLRDVQVVYAQYQSEIAGKYIDTEDYVDYYASKIGESEKLRNSEIWVHGFDYLTPKNMTVLGQLMANCTDVNVVLTCSYDKNAEKTGTFDITKGTIERLEKMAEELKVSSAKGEISGDYLKEKSPEECRIQLVQAANYYSEAETAAVHVRNLVRNEGARYRDICLICNDLEQRGQIIKRIFEEYGMDVFIDRKRNLMHNPAVSFIGSLLDMGMNGIRTPGIFKMLKTGLTEVKREDIEELENYAIKYKIKGTMWKKDFSRGTFEYTEKELAKINESRALAAGLAGSFEKGFRKEGSIKEKIKFMYEFLADTARLPERLEKLIDSQFEAGFYDVAGETAQAWNYIVEIFDQMVKILGDETLPVDAAGRILMSGLEAVEVGVLPPTADGLVLGNMQRTRNSENIKHVVVIGANEGVLPQDIGCDGILSTDEKRKLSSEDIEICKLDELRLAEEKLAIYKNLHSASDSLWMSCAVSDAEGSQLRPSMVFNDYKNDYPDVEVEKDVADSGVVMDKIQTPAATLKYMTEEVRNAMQGEKLSDDWKETLLWYQDNNPEALESVKSGLEFNLAHQHLDRETVKKLYWTDEKGQSKVSPSGLELYSSCPFRFFMEKGLRPHERRIYELGGREIGEIYHNSIMRFCQELTDENLEVRNSGSRWMTITEDEVKALIKSIVAEETKGYRDDVFHKGEEEEYRTARLIEICSQAAWALVENARNSEIETMVFEAGFGRFSNAAFKPVEISAGDTKVIVEGRIDRADFIAGDKVRIIDYKTGSADFTENEARTGRKLQLMLYLKAARGEEKIPAGVFYFKIAEPYVDVSGRNSEELADAVKKEVEKALNLQGINVGDEKSGSGKLMSVEDFEDFSRDIDDVISKICRDLTSGRIDIDPKKDGNRYVCGYCDFKGICLTDKK